MNSQPSMRDIAAAAGVSISTVSRVLNRNGRISPATRERVQKIIDESGYVVNMAARSLSSSCSSNIGLIVPDISNDFFSTLALHIEERLRANGYSVFVCNSSNDPEQERYHFRTLTSKLVDGVICISGLNELPDDVIPPDLPIVCVDRRPQSRRHIPTVFSDENAGTRAMTEHLISHGCRRLLYIGGFTAQYRTRTRISGFRDALAAHGLPLDEANVLQVTGKRPSMEEAHDYVLRRIADGLDFDGIVTSSDHAAAGALQALLQMDISVPGQVKVGGFDNSIYSRLTTPRITTIHRYPEQIASAACSRMLELLRREEPLAQTIIPVKLIVRESTVA